MTDAQGHGSDEPPAKRPCVQGAIGFHQLPPAFGHLSWHATLRDGGWKDGPIGEAKVRLGDCAIFRNFAALEDGTVIVADTDNHCIRRVRADFVDTLAGSGVDGWQDGKGTHASFSSPLDLCIARDGQVLVRDGFGAHVRQVSLDGTVTTFASLVSVRILHMAAKANRSVYVTLLPVEATWPPTVICELLPDSTYSVLAGRMSESGWRDGAGEDARFQGISDMTVSESGALFVTDGWCGSWCIRHVTADGHVKSLFCPSIDLPKKWSHDQDLLISAHSSNCLFLLNLAEGKCFNIEIVEERQSMKLHCLGESHVSSVESMFLERNTGVLYFICEHTGDDNDEEMSHGVYKVPLVPPTICKWQASLRCAELADVTFVVGAQKFHAARHTLAAQSEYFRSMFMQPMLESRGNDIVVKEASPESFEALLLYLYSGYVLRLPPMQTLELAQLADLHMLRELLTVCCALVLPTLTLDSVTDILLGAHRRGLSRIVDDCVSYLVANAASAAGAGCLTALAAEPQLAVRVMNSIALKS